MVNRIKLNNDVTRFFFALSDITRSRILGVMQSDHSKTPKELADRLRVKLPALMKHLSVLKNAGIIYCEKHGKSSQCFRADDLIKNTLNEFYSFLFKNEALGKATAKSEIHEDEVALLWQGYRMSKSPAIREKLLERYLYLVTYAVVRFSVASKGDPKMLMQIGRKVQEMEIDAHEMLSTSKPERFLLEKIQREFFKYFRCRKIKFRIPDDFVEKGETNVAIARFQRINESFSKRLRTVNPNEILLFILNHLQDRERQILALRYMENLTLKQIGRWLNLTDARISQIHAKAIGVIEKHFNESVVKESREISTRCE